MLWWTSNDRDRWITDKEQWLSTLVLTLSNCIYYIQVKHFEAMFLTCYFEKGLAALLIMGY